MAARTGPYFFYGTLMDPSLLSEILKLQTKPILRPAFVTSYTCKLWGQYPALVDGTPESIVEGAVYVVENEEHGKKLAYYETKNYRTAPCIINYTDGEKPTTETGCTFKFVGDVDDLSDGDFDLKIWMRRIGRRGVLDDLEARKAVEKDDRMN